MAEGRAGREDAEEEGVMVVLSFRAYYGATLDMIRASIYSLPNKRVSSKKRKNKRPKGRKKRTEHTLRKPKIETMHVPFSHLHPVAPLEQTIPNPPPNPQHNLLAAPELREHDNHVLLALDHDNEHVAHAEANKHLVDQHVADLLGGDEARGVAEAPERPGRARLDAEAAQHEHGLRYVKAAEREVGQERRGGGRYGRREGGREARECGGRRREERVEGWRGDVGDYLREREEGGGGEEEEPQGEEHEVQEDGREGGRRLRGERVLDRRRAGPPRAEPRVLGEHC